METTSTSCSEPERVSIEGVPFEILNKIFFFTCDGDCDISLSLTSRSMNSKLQNHPVIRTLRALMETQHIDSLFQDILRFDSRNLGQLLFQPGNGIGDGRFQALESIANTQWCTAAFVGRLQITLIKRVLRTYWDPLLARDGCRPSALSHEYVYLELEDFERNPAALCSEWLIESRVDAVRGRYPWTRVYVWPKQGRVLIRDQLLNTSVQYGVPLLENFLQMKMR